MCLQDLGDAAEVETPALVIDLQGGQVHSQMPVLRLFGVPCGVRKNALLYSIRDEGSIPKADEGDQDMLNGFRRTVLATSCLTAISGTVAKATTVFETTDFPATGPGTTLAPGVDQVQGSLATASSDYADWFEFTGLNPGNLFTLTGILTEYSGTPISFSAYPDSLAPILGTSGLSGVSSAINGIVPADGKLAVNVGFPNEEAGFGSYTLTLTTSATSAVPEPMTAVPVGAGLGAIALAWQRRRSRQS